MESHNGLQEHQGNVSRRLHGSRSNYCRRTAPNVFCLTHSKMGRTSHPSMSHPRRTRNHTSHDGAYLRWLAIGVPCSLPAIATDCGTNLRKPSKHEIWKPQQRPRVQSKMHNGNSVDDARNAARYSIQSISTRGMVGGNQSSRTCSPYQSAHSSAYQHVQHAQRRIPIRHRDCRELDMAPCMIDGPIPTT